MGREKLSFVIDGKKIWPFAFPWAVEDVVILIVGQKKLKFCVKCNGRMEAEDLSDLGRKL